MSDQSTGGHGRPSAGEHGEHSRRPQPPSLNGDRLPPLANQGPSASKPSISLPPPPPFRMHSYHHPLSTSSHAPGYGTSDRDRLPPPGTSQSPQRWSNAPADGPRGDGTSNELPRFLVQRSGSSSNGGFQLPPLSASFGSQSGWRSSASSDGLRRSPVSPDGGRGSHLEAFRENAAMMMGARPDDRMLPPFSPPLAGPSTSPLDSAMPSSASLSRDAMSSATRKMAKAHVPSACLNCKRAHLACDVGRPCRRCINLGKSDTCIDVQHKKRGRPRLKDRQDSQASISRGNAPINTGDASVGSDRTSTSPSSAMMRHSPQSEPGFYQSPPRQPGAIMSPILTSSSSVQRITGPTHGVHPQSRTPSASVSGSSYPFSRPDNARTFSDGQMVGGRGVSMPSASAVVTIICSTNLQCARVSEDCQVLLGYQPSEVLERSLFELVHPSESSRLEELWTSLIDPVGVVPQAVPASAEVVMSTPPARLMAPASGTIFVQENMRLRQRNGMFDFYSIRLHLGGGFGVDLYRRETLDRAYIVASLLKLGNDATHPDTALLRNPYHGGNYGGSGSAFWTPMAPPPANTFQPRGADGIDSSLRNGSGLSAFAAKIAPQQGSPAADGRRELATGPEVRYGRPPTPPTAVETPDLPTVLTLPVSARRSPVRSNAGNDGTRTTPPARDHEIGRREEAVPSYSKPPVREQAERVTARPSATTGATSPAGKRRSSISLSVTSPHASFRGTVLSSSSRTSSSRDGITC